MEELLNQLYAHDKAENFLPQDYDTQYELDAWVFKVQNLLNFKTLNNKEFFNKVREM